MESNKELFSTMSYSLRPRGVIRLEESRSGELGGKRPLKTQRKQRSLPLSKYRRKTANARERSRMREINEAFETLRRVIPQMASGGCNAEKLTKISTLRLAMKYISALRSLLEDREFEYDGESFPEDYAISATSLDSQIGMTSVTHLGDAPSDSPGVTPFVNPFVSSSDVFDDSSYSLDEGPFFMSEIS